MITRRIGSNGDMPVYVMRANGGDGFSRDGDGISVMFSVDLRDPEWPWSPDGG